MRGEEHGEERCGTFCFVGGEEGFISSMRNL